MNNLVEAGVSISLAIVGLAIVAVLVSRNANTAGVMQAYGQTFSSMIGAATAPVTGASQNTGMPNLSPILGGGQFASFY